MMEGMNSSMIYLIYCKNFCKCHNVPPPSTIKKLKRRKEFEDLEIYMKMFREITL
jgi:hypothetical protein